MMTCPRLTAQPAPLWSAMTLAFAASTAQAVAPSAPGLPSGVVTGDRIALRWTQASDDEAVAGYNVYRDDAYLATVRGTSYTATLSDSDATRFYVTAFDDPSDNSARGYSTRSPEASFTRAASTDPVPETEPDTQPSPGQEPADGPDTSRPGAATDLAAQSDGTGARLNWTAASDDRGIRGYNVYRDDRYIATVKSTSFDDAQAGSEYYIVAFDEARNFGPRSATVALGDAPTPTPAPTPEPGPDTDLPPASPPTLDEPFADAIKSPSVDDPFGYFLEQEADAAITGGGPTQPKNLRLDLVSNDWAEISWSPSNDDGAVVAYEITRSDGVSYRITESLPAGTALSEGTYAEYAKYWATTSFIDCNDTRFAFSPGSAKDNVAPWNCVNTGPNPGDDFSYTVAAIDDLGNRSPESNVIDVAYAETIDAPVPYYDDLYKPSRDRFASDTDLSNTAYFLDRFDLVFEDDFDAGAVDPAKWNTSLVWGDNFIINGEQQYFVDTQRNPDFGYDPFVFDGTANTGAEDGRALSIAAASVPDALRGALPEACEQTDPTGLDRCEFLSGALSSHDRFSFIYGYVEGRIKASPANGALSSFYLYHRYKGGGSRPAYRHGPEIDIVEYLGENPFGDEDAFQTYHYTDPNTDIIRSSPTMNVQKNADDSSDIYGGEYHTYGVLWEPQLVIWYIDGVEVKRLFGPQIARQPMNIVNYLVTGSEWAPTPMAGDFPIDMGVDYIRVYQRDPFKSTASFGRQ